jgi:hypothetical protein
VADRRLEDRGRQSAPHRQRDHLPRDAVLLAFFLISVITSSTAVSIMTTFGIFLFGAAMAGHKQYSAAVSKIGRRG